MKLFLRQHKTNIFFVCLILLLGSIKYFYQAIVLNPFEIDQEFLALEAWNYIKVGKATLIGAHTSTGGMYIGPFYTYFITVVMALTNLNPWSINLLSATWATLTAVALYFVGKHLFSREVGVVAGLIAATSISYLTILEVPPLVVPLGLVSLLTFYCLSQIDQHRWLLLAAVFLGGVGIHLHFTGIYLSIFIILWMITRKIKPTIKETIISIGMIIFFLSPLILFDLRHNFLNSRNFITFLLTTNGLKVIIMSMQRSFWLALGSLGALFNNFQTHNLLISSIVWGIFVIYFIFNRRRTLNHKLLLTWLIFPIIVNGLYSGELLPYYYILHHAQIFLVIGLLLEPIVRHKNGTTAFITLTLLYTILNLRYHQARPNAFRLQNKMAAFETIRRIGGDPNSVNLSLTIDFARRGGIEFLQKYYGYDTQLLKERPTYTIVSPHAWHRLKGDYTFGEFDVILPEKKP